MQLSRVTIVTAAIVAAVILLGAGTVVGYIAGRSTVGRFQSMGSEWPDRLLDTATGKVCRVKGGWTHCENAGISYTPAAQVSQPDVVDRLVQKYGGRQPTPAGSTADPLGDKAINDILARTPAEPTMKNGTHSSPAVNRFGDVEAK